MTTKVIKNWGAKLSRLSLVKDGTKWVSVSATD